MCRPLLSEGSALHVGCCQMRVRVRVRVRVRACVCVCVCGSFSKEACS